MKKGSKKVLFIAIFFGIMAILGYIVVGGVGGVFEIFKYGIGGAIGGAIFALFFRFVKRRK